MILVFSPLSMQGFQVTSREEAELIQKENLEKGVFVWIIESMRVRSAKKN